jgi:hypothetical protein
LWVIKSLEAGRWLAEGDFLLERAGSSRRNSTDSSSGGGGVGGAVVPSLTPSVATAAASGNGTAASTASSNSGAATMTTTSASEQLNPNQHITDLLDAMRRIYKARGGKDKIRAKSYDEVSNALKRMPRITDVKSLVGVKDHINKIFKTGRLKKLKKRRKQGPDGIDGHLGRRARKGAGADQAGLS